MKEHVNTVVQFEELDLRWYLARRRMLAEIAQLKAARADGRRRAWFSRSRG
jgi:hypothetical protein